VLSRVNRPENDRQTRTVSRGLQAAILAPSAHNSQPWRFGIDGETIRLGWDARRRLPAGDPAGAYLAIGLGAAVESLALGLATDRVGCEVAVDWRLDACQMATIRLVDGAACNDGLAAHLTARKTTRLPFAPQPVSESDQTILDSEARRGGCMLVVAQERQQLRAIAEATGEGTARNFADAAVFDEFCGWLRRPGDPRFDGLAFDALELRGARAIVARYALRPASMRTLRRTSLHRLLAAEQTRLAMATGTFCLLTVPSTALTDMFQAGRTIQRVWLRATALGLRVHPMTAALDHIETRSALASSFGIPPNTAIAICFRLGYGPAGVRSRRMPLEQFLD